jgi:hypothetical protein
MEDGNSAHGHESTRNCCAQFHTKHGIILMPHPSTSPDINPIEEVLAEDQAGIAQTAPPTYYSGRDGNNGLGGMGSDTSGLDK